MRVAGAGLTFAFVALLARTLTAADFALVLLVINLALIGAVLVSVGCDVAMLRLGSKAWADDNKQRFKDHLQQGRKTIAVSGILALSALLLLSVLWPLGAIPDNPLLALFLGLAALAIALSALNRDSLRAAGRLGHALGGEMLVRNLCALCVLAVCAALGLVSAYSALAAYGLGLCAALVWEQICLAQLRLDQGDKSGPSLLPIALGVWPGELALIVFLRIGGVMVALGVGLEEAALFLAAERLAALSTFPAIAVRTAFAPALAQAEPSQRQACAARVSAALLAAGLIGFGALAALGWPLLWLLGEGFLAAYPLLLVLLVGHFSWIVFGPAALTLNMMGAERTRSTITVAGALCLSLALTNAATAMQIATLFAAGAWAMNGALWLVAKRRLGLTLGVFALNATLGTETVNWFQNPRQMWRTLVGQR